MIGIKIDGLCSIFCDNYAPESTLSKKHNATGYHRVWELVVEITVCVAHEEGLTNLADILTKPLALG